VTSIRTAALARLRRDRVSNSLWLTAIWTGFGAAVIACTIAIAAVALLWMPAAGASGHWTSTVKAGLLTSLAALHGGITVDETPTAFLPLGLLLLAGLICWRAGVALGARATELEESDPVRLALAGATQAVAFTVTMLAVGPFAELGTSSASFLGVAAAGLALFTLSGGVAFVRWSVLSDWVAQRTPALLPGAARAGSAALLVYAVVGCGLVMAELIVHHSRVETLARHLGGGWSGVPVLVLGVLAAPNAVIAAMAYLIGPGFVVGSGTSVSAGSAAHGLLPAFPLLGGLPDGKAGPVAWTVLVATPVLAGVVLARMCRGGSALRQMVKILLAAGFAGLVMAILAWQGGGGIGADRLATIGASPWLCGTWLAGELAVAGLVVLGVEITARWLGRDRGLPHGLVRLIPGGDSSDERDLDDDGADRPAVRGKRAG
jgi:hypothetical protein